MSIVDSRSDPDPVVLTGREMDVMNVLWKLGSGTVSEVQGALSDDLAYTTVLTILRTLEKKGHVGHEAEGRAHRYLPLVEKEEAQVSAIRRITGKLFSGSPELLMAQLLSERGLTEDQLRRLRDLVDDRLQEEEE
ncbi:MAG: BlaI/MecI/CopY family transcriptional regulator [Longimicrobiales bacterium]